MIISWLQGCYGASLEAVIENLRKIGLQFGNVLFCFSKITFRLWPIRRAIDKTVNELHSDGMSAHWAIPQSRLLPSAQTRESVRSRSIFMLITAKCTQLNVIPRKAAISEWICARDRKPAAAWNTNAYKLKRVLFAAESRLITILIYIARLF